MIFILNPEFTPKNVSFLLYCHSSENLFTCVSELHSDMDYAVILTMCGLTVTTQIVIVSIYFHPLLSKEGEGGGFLM